MSEKNPLYTLEDVKRAIAEVPAITREHAEAMAELCYYIGRREAFTVSKEIVGDTFTQMEGRIDALKTIVAERRLAEMPPATTREQ